MDKKDHFLFFESLYIHRIQRGKQRTVLQRHQRHHFPGRPAASGSAASRVLAIVPFLPGEIWDRRFKCGEVGHSAGWLSQATGFARSKCPLLPKKGGMAAVSVTMAPCTVEPFVRVSL